MAGVWSSVEVGKSVNGYDLTDLTTKKSTSVRKVTSSVSGNSEIVSEGDTSLFKESKNKLAKDDFMNLLLAQLKYQDPLSPQENTEYVSQLAQFSSLENSQSMESAITSLSSDMKNFMTLQTINSASSVNAASTSLLGKSVRVGYSDVQWAGKSVKLDMQLNDGATSAIVAVKDAQGNYVSTEKISTSKDKPDVEYSWDGFKDDGSKASYGSYTVEILDSSKIKTVGTIYKDGEVSGLKYTSDGAKLIVDNGTYSLKDIISVNT